MALIRLNPFDPNASNDYIKSLTGKPVGNPPVLSSNNILGQVMQYNFTYVSTNTASSLGFGFGNIDASEQRRVLTFDFATLADINDPTSAQNGVDSWTYGAGYRIGIFAYGADASSSFGLAALAAKATLQNSQIMIQILSYGMPGGPAIPVANFTKFDVESYGNLVKWQSDVIAYVNTNKPNLSPLRVYASLSIDMDQYYNDTAPVRFALRRIQRKVKLSDTLSEINKNQIPYVVGQEAIIRATYARITGYNQYLISGTIDNQPIYDNAQNVAETWIEQFN